MNIDEYQQFFGELIQLEQDEEMKRHREEMRTLSAREREERGRSVTEMTVRHRETGLRDEDRVTFRKRNGEPLPDLEITVGDVVQIARDQPLNDDNPTATVWEKTNRALTLGFNRSLPGWAEQGPVRIDLMVDNITYQRMLDALFVLPALTGEKQPLRDVLVGLREPDAPEEAPDPEWVNPNLNESQREAVRGALGSEQLFLVHGPPGTGKTVTMTEIIAQEVRRGNTVLATAASNVAVDNLLEHLIASDVDAVRVGHPARTTPRLRRHTLDARVEEFDEYQRSQACRQKALELIEQRREFTPPRGRWRRGLSNDAIRTLAKENEGARGLSASKIQEMAGYLELSERIDELFETCDRLENEAIEKLLDSVPVICTTNATAGSEMLGGHDVDVVCVDEATQATEPSCLIPATKGTRLIMAGDHRQLPPTILNPQARDRGLGQTLFERLMKTHGESISKRLRIQYRMHRDIMDFSSRQFYDGSLEADTTVASHTLEELTTFRPGSLESPWRSHLRGHPPVVWVDTGELTAPEHRRSGSTSVANLLESRIIRQMAEDYLEAGLPPRDLAVIAPYKDQVDTLRGSLDVEDLEIDTVDGFQGREKDVILLSLVRSNPDGTIGFLKDERRLNVSLTRARRKLILVGDTDTVCEHSLYQKLLEYVQQRGQHWRPGPNEVALSTVPEERDGVHH